MQKVQQFYTRTSDNALSKHSLLRKQNNFAGQMVRNHNKRFGLYWDVHFLGVVRAYG